MKFHAVFDIEKETPEYVYIKDTGTDNRSVTNDAEYVLEELSNEYTLNNRRVFYMDSTGEIDEIVHSMGHFERFKFGHEGVEL